MGRSMESSERLIVGDVEFYPGRHEARRRGRVVPLTPLESALLGVLMSRPNHLISTRALSYAIWGDDANKTGSIRVHVCNLRRKIESEGAFIEGRYGSGYMVTAL